MRRWTGYRSLTAALGRSAAASTALLAACTMPVGCTILAACTVLAGCTTMLDLDAPHIAPDAATDRPELTRPDGSVDAAPVDACPAAPAGCTPFRCGASASCYYSCSGAVSWNTAHDYCAQVGCLATIESQAEQDCITAATAPTNGSPVWIGSYQQLGANEPMTGWTWACGTSTYADWASFEPNDLYGDQDCVALTANGHWNDLSCTYARRFVCERP